MTPESQPYVAVLFYPINPLCGHKSPQVVEGGDEP